MTDAILHRELLRLVFRVWFLGSVRAFWEDTSVTLLTAAAPPDQHTPDCTLGRSRPTDPHPTLQRK